MGISRSNPIPTTTPVTPGTSVVQSVYTDGGFTAGDYVYRYNGNSVGQYPYFGSALPGVSLNTVIAGTKYTLSAGTGVTAAKSSMISPAAAGTTYTATLPTTSTLGSVLVAQQNVTTPSALWFSKCATLTNGNVVVLYTASGNVLSFKIYNPSGTALYSVTIATVNVQSLTAGFTYEPNYAVCGLASGGFAIIYRDTSESYHRINTYDSTGTFVATSGPLSQIGIYCGDMCTDPSGNLYVISSTDITSASIYPYATKITSALVYSNQLYLNIWGNPSYYSPMRIAYTLSGQVAVAWGYSSNLFFGLLNSGLTALISGTNSSISSASYSSFGLQPSLEADGGAFLVYVNNSASLGVTYIYNGSYTTYNPSTGDATTSRPGADCCPSYITTAGVNNGTTNGIVCYYTSSSGTTIVSRIVTLAANRTTWAISSPVTPTFTLAGDSSSGYPSIKTCACGATGNFLVGNTTSSVPTFAISGSYTYASTNVTVNFPANLQPTPVNGFSLIGVAATTAAAGSYGSVVINGVTSVASTYGTSATSYGFNYNPQNGNGFLGNAGYVVNRVVTLQGLE